MLGNKCTVLSNYYVLLGKNMNKKTSVSLNMGPTHYAPLFLSYLLPTVSLSSCQLRSLSPPVNYMALISATIPVASPAAAHQRGYYALLCLYPHRQDAVLSP
jgi:hypothetical protein